MKVKGRRNGIFGMSENSGLSLCLVMRPKTISRSLAENMYLKEFVFCVRVKIKSLQCEASSNDPTVEIKLISISHPLF